MQAAALQLLPSEALLGPGHGCAADRRPAWVPALLLRTLLLRQQLLEEGWVLLQHHQLVWGAWAGATCTHAQHIELLSSHAQPQPQSYAHDTAEWVVSLGSPASKLTPHTTATCTASEAPCRTHNHKRLSTVRLTWTGGTWEARGQLEVAQHHAGPGTHAGGHARHAWCT